MQRSSLDSRPKFFRSLSARSRSAAVGATLATLVAAMVGGCAVGEPRDDVADADGVVQSPIINGTPDTTHPAVVAVLSNNGACTGTIIHVDGSNGFVITAAHCTNPQVVVQATDYNSQSAIVYNVTASEAHPSYNQAVYDFRMVRFTGASANTPVIPAMTPAQDNITVGTPVLHVGYGKAGPSPGGNNSLRRQYPGTIGQVSALTLSYNQPNGGPCNGDSGGPNLTTGTERVAGVVSYGDQDCNIQGTSGRVSAIYDSFIIPFINNTPTGGQTCDQCQQAVTSGQGTCTPEVQACLNSNDCNNLLSCFEGCSANSCYQACVNNNPNGWAIYENITACICDTGCATECANEGFCQQGGATSSTSATVTTAVTSTGVGPAATGATTGGAVTTGGGVGGAAGVDASAGTGDGWNAGEQGPEDYDNAILASSCSVSEPGNRSARTFGWLGLLGLGYAAARRRSGRG